MFKILLVIAFSLLCYGCKAKSDPAPSIPIREVDPRYMEDTGCGLLPEITPDPALPNMLVIGDSISLKYTPPLRDLMRDYNIYHNPCNGASSGHGLYNIDKYLVLLHYDVIIFNHGIWDIAENITAVEYRENLKGIISKMRGRANRIIFLTTTYVSIYDANHAALLRATALDVMRSENIEVLDIYPFSEAIKDKQIDGVHYNDDGSLDLAMFIMNGVYQ